MYIFIFVAISLGFFLLAMLKPKFAVLLLLGSYALWPEYVAFLIPSVGGVNPQRILSLLLIVAWVIQIVHLPSMRHHLLEVVKGNQLVVFSALIYFMYGIFTAFIASAQPSKSMSSAVITFISFPLIMIFVISYFSKRKEILQLFFTIILLAIFTEIIGIFEWINQGNLFAIFIDPVSDIAEQMMQGTYRNDIYRIQSTFTNPLSFAEFLMLIMPISMYFLSPRKSGVAIRVLATIQVVLGVFCIYLTASRASMLLVVMMITFLLALNFGHKVSKTAIMASVSAALLFILVFVPWGGVLEYLIGKGDTINSTIGRLYQLQEGIPAVFISPFWGYGLGQGVLFVAPLVSIDNYYLTAALETGLVGLTTLLIFQGAVLKLAISSRNNSMFPLFGQFALVAFLALFINELTLSIIQPFTFFYAIVGILLVMKIKTKCS